MMRSYNSPNESPPCFKIAWIFFQILKAKLNLPPYLTNEARGLIKKVSGSFKYKLLSYLILHNDIKNAEIQCICCISDAQKYLLLNKNH